MKLYNIPKKSKIRLTIASPRNPKGSEQVCTFDHIDGMYSHITTPKGHVVHLGASTELVLGKDNIYDLK